MTVIQRLINKDPNFTHLAIDIQTLFILNFVIIVHFIVIYFDAHIYQWGDCSIGIIDNLASM